MRPKGNYLKAGHERDFKKAITNERLYRASYEYKEEQQFGQKKKKTDENGDVIVENRNFYTSPPKGGVVGKGTTFGGILEHAADVYEVHKLIAKKELAYHNTKIQDKAFCPRPKHTEYFNKPRDVLEEEPRMKDHKLKVDLDAGKEPVHDKPFYRGMIPKKGNKGTIDKFPEYVEDPPKEKKRIRLADDAEVP